MPSKKIEVKGLEIRIEQIEESDFVSLTDIAAQVDNEPRFTIRNWIRNNQTLEFMETWEVMHNDGFNRAASGTFRLNANSNTFSPTPQKWIRFSAQYSKNNNTTNLSPCSGHNLCKSP